MSAVLSAVRGGPASEATLARAAALARERSLPLHLLYVVNLDFLTQVTGGHIPTVDEEITAMGEFILEVAKGDAEAMGVEVVTHVRHGQVLRQVIDLANELAAEVIVVGKRTTDSDHPAGTPVVLRFADGIRAETDAEVVVIETEST